MGRVTFLPSSGVLFIFSVPMVSCGSKLSDLIMHHVVKYVLVRSCRQFIPVPVSFTYLPTWSVFSDGRS